MEVGSREMSAPRGRLEKRSDFPSEAENPKLQSRTVSGKLRSEGWQDSTHLQGEPAAQGSLLALQRLTKHPCTPSAPTHTVQQHSPREWLLLFIQRGFSIKNKMETPRSPKQFILKIQFSTFSLQVAMCGALDTFLRRYASSLEALEPR